MLEVIRSIAMESFILLAQMGPYLLLGIVFAGLLHVLLPVDTVARYLGGRGFGAVLRAAVIGVPLPICSCGVVPVAASLKKSGASNGATVSFLATTPTTGVDSILATYSLLGGPLALARVAWSFAIGLVAGVATNLSERRESHAPSVADNAFSIKQDGNTAFRAISYSLGELMGGIARPLAIGTLLGGAIAYLLPPGLLAHYMGQGVGSYLVMIVVGTPLYICASGSIPLAAALLAKGISPGAALVFLIAGPATNIATMTVISDMLGKKRLFIYLSVLVLGSLAAGFGTDAAFETLGIGLPSMAPIGMHGEHAPSVFKVVSGIVLGLIVFYHLGKQVAARIGGMKIGESMFQLRVKDMSCQHCAGTIRGAVCGLDGVRKVDADPATKIVSIDMDDDVDRDAVAQAILDAGFHPEAL